MNFPTLFRQLNTFPGEPLPSCSPHAALVRVAGTCAKHGLELFKLANSKTVCACDKGCLLKIGTLESIMGV